MANSNSAPEKIVVVSDFMLTVAAKKARKRLHQGSVAGESGPLKSFKEYGDQADDQKPLSGPLTLGKVTHFLFFQSNKNVRLRLTDAAGVSVDLLVGRFFHSYLEAENVVIAPISDGTYLTTFFY